MSADLGLPYSASMELLGAVVPSTGAAHLI